MYGTRGAVTSPGFPSPYNNTNTCTWTLRVPNGQRLELSFTSFMVGSGAGETCSGNYLQILDGEVGTSYRRLAPR